MTDTPSASRMNCADGLYVNVRPTSADAATGHRPSRAIVTRPASSNPTAQNTMSWPGYLSGRRCCQD